jgi:hypothetical protein
MEFPRFGLVRQNFPPSRNLDPKQCALDELKRSELLEPVRSGQSVAVCAGSRGIDAKPGVLAGVIEAVKARGGRPFVFPAMGSHGGGTGPGQVDVLAHLGVTESSVGAPILDRTAPEPIGEMDRGAPVFADRAAIEADHIILVNRVKEHTEYTGPTESGLIKMAAIGLGRQPGAESVHRLAVQITYYQAIQAAAKVLFDRLNILGGLAILEDHHNQLRRLEAVPAASLFDREPDLLAESRKFKPKLPFDELDLLIVDQIGKEISGTGADTKVVGRIMNIYEAEVEKPHITRIVIRDLSQHTAGNAIGLGLADFTTRRAVEKIDFEATAINSITGGTPEKGRVPLAMENDRQAVESALRTVGLRTAQDLKAAWITDTKSLDALALSQALMSQAGEMDQLIPIGNPFQLDFDADGNLPRLKDLVAGAS